MRVLGKLRKMQPSPLPFLVGGTMQYIDAVVDNWIIPDVPPNPELRASLEAEPLEKLVDRIRTLAPEISATLDLQNKRKVIRALEIHAATGLTVTRARRRGKPQFQTVKIGVEQPREVLYERINARVHQMIEAGLVAEVRALAERYGWDAPGLQAQGYIQLKPYFDGERTLDQCVADIQQASRHYAKRQLTWWRRDNAIQWIKSAREARELLKQFL